MNVFITGGSRGIGRALVERFAQEGHVVLFTYNTNEESAKEITKEYNNAAYYECDIKDYLMCQHVARDILEKYEHIDVVINNAGITKDKTFVKMEKETWDEVIDINLKSIYHFTHPFIEGMINNKWGRIINISSVIGQKGAFGQTNYAASKAGIIGFTKALAIELASKQITVNAIAPGMIQTDMMAHIPSHHLADIKNNIPMKQFGEIEDIAEMGYYLASDKAKYITGQVLGINGGMYL